MGVFDWFRRRPAAEPTEAAEAARVEGRPEAGQPAAAQGAAAGDCVEIPKQQSTAEGDAVDAKVEADVEVEAAAGESTRKTRDEADG